MNAVIQKEKGQEFVEFAVVTAIFFPIILVLVCGIMYCGFLFGDYITLSNIVRSAAREAALSVSTTSTSKVDHIAEVKNNYDSLIAREDFITHLYEVDSNGITIDGPDSDGMIKASVTVVRNPDFQITNILENLGVDMSKSQYYRIDSYMYDEDHTSS